MKRLIAALLALVALTLLTACGVKPNDSRVVLKLDGEKVYYDYYRYVFMNSKRDMDGGDASYWTRHPEAEAALRESVMEVLLHYRAVQRLAEKYDVSLTKAQKQAIKDDLAAAKAATSGGEAAYLASLEEAYMSEYALLYIRELTELWSRLYDYVTDEMNGIIACSDEVLDADIPKNFRRIRYVYIAKDAEHPEATAAIAEEVSEKAADGADFNGLIEEYGEDPDMDRLLADGYYYTLGAIDEEVQKAVELLAEGEIAPVIEVSYGYYVVQRLGLDDAYVNKNYESFRAQYCARIFNEMLKAEAEAVKITYEELFEELTVAAMS